MKKTIEQIEKECKIIILREIETTKKNRHFEVICGDCRRNSFVSITTVYNSKNYGFRGKWVCFECNRKEQSKMSSMTKRKPKTKSGYQGITLSFPKDCRQSYTYARIMQNGKMLLNNRYFGTDEDTIKNAAVDRDIFIVKNNLPHYRNFTDEELYKSIELSKASNF